nr:16S rRNA (uracil(1498)-N(3))-methyltransferase [bacterium]
MARIFVDSLADGKVALSPADSRHIARVLRLGAGDSLVLVCDGQEAQAKIVQASPEQVICRVGQVEPSKTEPTLQVTLYQGLPKFDKLESVIQKGVELGVARIVPVIMDRSVPRLAEGARGKLERWRTIAREAAQQSRRGRVPQVEQPVPFMDCVQEMASSPLALAMDEEGGIPFARAIGGAKQRVALLIGPEGGIAAGERQALAQAGVIAVTMGPRILRTETAGPAALAALMCATGEWE